jgi:flagellar hook-associated protein 2
MAFTIGGLASGIDTKNIVSQLVDLQRRPIQNLERRIFELEQVQSVYSSLGSSVAALNTAAGAMTTDNLDLTSVSVSDPDAITVISTSDALNGKHDIVVQQLAESHRIGSQGFTNADGTAISSASGTFTFQVGVDGAQTSIAVTGSTTLNELANAINTADADVSASVVNDGTLADSFRLVLTSSETGAANTIQINSNPTNLNFSSATIEAAVGYSSNSGTYSGAVASGGTYTSTSRETYQVRVKTGGAVGVATYEVSSSGGITWDDNGGLGFTTSSSAVALGSNGVTVQFSESGTLSVGDQFEIDVAVPELQSAKNSLFTLDGIFQGRETNMVDDALEGITVDLKQVDAATSIDFAVSRPPSTILNRVQDLLDAYNAVQSTVRNQQFFDSETQESGVLIGDSTANQLLSIMRGAVTQSAENVTGSLSNLTDLGVSTGADGALSLDITKLMDLIDSDRSSVLKVLAATATSSVSNIQDIDLGDGVPAGDYAVNITKAAEKAKLTATAAQTDTIAAEEILSFRYSRNATESGVSFTEFSVTLQTGDTIAQMVNRLNSAFKTQAAGITAYVEAGVLTIEGTDYGQDIQIQVTSDTASGAGTSRIGTTTIVDSGEDVAGTINGEVTTGIGSRLEVDDGGSLEGMIFNYVGAATGVVGNINTTRGISELFTDMVKRLNDGDASLLTIRNEALSTSIETLVENILKEETRVQKLEARLNTQFVRMELALAKINQQGDFLTNALAQIEATSLANRD